MKCAEHGRTIKSATKRDNDCMKIQHFGYPKQVLSHLVHRSFLEKQANTATFQKQGKLERFY